MKGKKRKSLFWIVVGLCSIALIGLGISPALAQDIEVDNEGNPFIAPELPEIKGMGEPVTLEGEAPAEFEESFGGNTQATWIPAWQFEASQSSEVWGYTNIMQRYSTSGNGVWSAPVRLPSGARVTQVTFYYYDNDTQNIILQFFRANNSTNYTTLINYGVPSLVNGYANTSVGTNIRIANGNGYYFVRFDLYAPAGSNHRFWGVKILWERDIRTGLPNPFNDIGGLPSEFQSAITALYASGITTGTTSTTYSPFQSVNRAQMAVFLARALGLYWAYPAY
jgi:hypothetical protein